MTMNKSILLTYLAQVQNLNLATTKINCTCASNPALMAHLSLLIKSMTGRMVSFRGAVIVGIAHDVDYNAQKWNMVALLRVSVLWHDLPRIYQTHQRRFTSLQLLAKGER